jgi:hypothetical protein
MGLSVDQKVAVGITKEYLKKVNSVFLEQGTEAANILNNQVS